MVNVAFGTGTFTKLFLLLFSLKTLKLTKPQKKVKKTKEEITKHVKESLLMDEIANQDIEKKQKTLKIRRRW